MSQRIFKYPLAEFSQTLWLAAGAHFLTAQMQDRKVTLWAAVTVDSALPVESRRIRVLPTGDELPPGFEYIATVQDGPYVWHVFEEHGQINGAKP